MKSITPTEFVALGAGAVLVDVREPDEVATVRVPGALVLPMSTLDQHLDELPDGSFYVMCHAGGRSARVVTALEQQGYDAVNVLGGITQWEQEGLPVER
ncbi:rhodanese-like domain-containing protein [Lysinimonas soli]|uniref:Rhodanese-like domain-containing protein n=1 Tax=Lysinimonas soli TaxID=1074233 RepID=A0ABW0NXK2_9MICO